MTRSVRFTHEGRNLEIRAIQGMNGDWQIGAFEGSAKVTAPTYVLSFDTEIAGSSMGVDLVDHLMQVAQSDVEMGIVELQAV